MVYIYFRTISLIRLIFELKITRCHCRDSIHQSREQLYSLFIGAAVQVARICNGDDRLAGPCTSDVGVALSVGVV